MRQICVYTSTQLINELASSYTNSVVNKFMPAISHYFLITHPKLVAMIHQKYFMGILFTYPRLYAPNLFNEEGELEPGTKSC